MLLIVLSIAPYELYDHDHGTYIDLVIIMVIINIAIYNQYSSA